MAHSQLVVIGASSGGLEAILALLHGLAPDYAVPIVVVLHQRANRQSGIPAMLSSHTHLLVVEPDDKQAIEQGHLYVAPPNYHLLIEKEKIFSLSSEAPVQYSRPSIDVTFESAAHAYGPNAVACVLSGANQDGAAGAAEIKRWGGRVFIQSRLQAEVSVMPDAVAGAIDVDGELTLQAMANMLNAFSRSERPG